MIHPIKANILSPRHCIRGKPHYIVTHSKFRRMESPAPTFTWNVPNLSKTNVDWNYWSYESRALLTLPLKPRHWILIDRLQIWVLSSNLETGKILNAEARHIWTRSLPNSRIGGLGQPSTWPYQKLRNGWNRNFSPKKYLFPIGIIPNALSPVKSQLLLRVSR
jgi:hypothetical protein